MLVLGVKIGVGGFWLAGVGVVFGESAGLVDFFGGVVLVVMVGGVNFAISARVRGFICTWGTG